ncbi:PDZ domain-containing protein [Streptomyces sp. TRM 70351]|uniref:YlbL family protein n=1 Tax=Streptomyces sp. TRM 70351 TaxID=3116552 RepID=UPI002E7BB5D3|nr:PDZ domain-containing protein [Streptomyces sp. TRM 70351]MEE1927676.1 PDZ domain-containing protein [Streptomyces sp. TRM 70351]
MSRRHATILASTLLLIGMLCAVALVRVPYSELSPGPTVNTLGEYDGDPVLSIEGRETYPTSGHLNMTTVRVTSADYRMTLGEALYSWLADDAAVVPHDSLYPDGTTAEEAEEENAEEFSQSQQSAKVAALAELGIPVPTRTVVSAVVKDSPAEGTLRAGDVIKAVDGTPVREPADVARLVTEHEPGEDVVFTVVPAKAAEAAEKAGEDPLTAGTREVTVATAPAEDDQRAIVGIQAGTAHTFPFDIDIKLADVGGPSAGLMFALGIVDKLTDEELTGGTFVAGTGTIDGEGEVGPIGGVTMKTRAAAAAGARYFLTPEENCATAAKERPDGLTLVEVGTMDDALEALRDIREDDTESLPLCTAAD